MLSLSSTCKFELYLPPTDMRKSFDSLCGIIQSELSEVPTNGWYPGERLLPHNFLKN